MIIGTILWLTASIYLEPLIDSIIGNNDGSFVYLHYFNFGWVVLLVLLYISTSITENISKFLFPILTIILTIWAI